MDSSVNVIDRTLRKNHTNSLSLVWISSEILQFSRAGTCTHSILLCLSAGGDVGNTLHTQCIAEVVSKSINPFFKSKNELQLVIHI